MSEILSQSEIDNLLMGIDAAETSEIIPCGDGNSKVKKYYFSRPDVVSAHQKNMVANFVDSIIPSISTYLTQLLDEELRIFTLAIDELSTEEFQRCITNDTYLYKYEIGSLYGYMELDPVFFNETFLKRSGKNKCDSLGLFEKSICNNYLIKPILGKLKPLFSFNNKECVFSKISSTPSSSFENLREGILLISIELNLINGGSDGGIIDIAIPKNILTKMKTNGFLKDDNIVFPRKEKGNSEVIVGSFFIENKSKLEKGKVYVLNQSADDCFTVMSAGKKVAEAEVVIIDNDNLGIRVVHVPGVNSLQNNMQKKLGQNLVPPNTKVVLGNFELPVQNKLKEGDVILLDSHSGEPFDIVQNGAVIAKGEIYVVEENLAVQVISIL